MPEYVEFIAAARTGRPTAEATAATRAGADASGCAVRRVVRIILGGTAERVLLPKTAGPAAATVCAGATRIEAFVEGATMPGCICWLTGTLRGLRSGDA